MFPPHFLLFFFFFFNDTATTEIYTLSLHDALPISLVLIVAGICLGIAALFGIRKHGKKGILAPALVGLDRKSTRLNSSHGYISYAVFCLKKKKKQRKLRKPPVQRSS